MILIQYYLYFQSVPGNIAWGSISTSQACEVSTMVEGNISVQIWKTIIIVSIAQICYKLSKEKLNCKLFDIYIVYL